MSVYIRQNSVRKKFHANDNWLILSSLEQAIKDKIESIGTPLSAWGLNINRGLLTGLNDAFIISAEKREALIAEDPKSAEIIRPILRGRDIKRYQYNFANLYLIVAHNGNKKKNVPRINIDDYPAIKKHLLSFGDKLISRFDQGDTPFNLRNCIYMDDFSKQKIVYREISDSMNACLVEPDIYLNNKCYLITGNHLIYLLSIFNSLLFTKMIMRAANLTGGKGVDFLSKIKIPSPQPDIEQRFIKLYQQRMSGENVDALVDQLVFSIFQISKEESSYIEHM